MKIATKTEPNREKLQTLTEVGFNNVEVFTNEKIINNPNSISMLNDFDFNYAVHSPTAYFNESVIEFASKIGANTINTHKIVTHDRLRQLVKHASDRGIQITVENDSLPAGHQIVDGEYVVWPADGLHSAADARRLAADVPGVLMCLDIEHAHHRGELDSWLADIVSSDLVGHIHLTGYNEIKPKGDHRPVHESATLVDKTIKSLIAINYTGFLVCEHNTEFQTREIWEQTLRYCQQLVDKYSIEELYK